jgi:hypothetical protein
MRISLIQTLGTRDVTIDLGVVERNTDKQVYASITTTNIQTQKPMLIPRAGGAFLLQQYARFSCYIHFPILNPVLEFIFSEHKRIAILYLIATDQPESVGKRFYENDSIEYANVIKYHLKNRYKDMIENIETVTVSENVSYLDYQYDFWKTQIRSNAFKKLWAKSLKKVYVCNQGGIDAINTAILLQLLHAFGSKVISLNVNERTDICTPLKFGKLYLNEKIESQLVTLIDAYNYAGVEGLELPAEVLQIARYARARLDFDFDRAKKALHAIDNIELRSFRDKELMILTQLEKGSERIRLNELYVNAIIKFKQGSYVDFLIRLFNIKENLHKLIALRKLPGFEYPEKDFSEAVQRYLENPEHSDLKDYLTNKYSWKSNDGKDIYLDLSIRHPSWRFWDAICRYYKVSDVFMLIMDILQELADLRNNSIGAHGFNPVSKEMIEHKIHLVDPKVSIDKFINTLSNIFEYKENPFDIINNKIKALMAQ